MASQGVQSVAVITCAGTTAFAMLCGLSLAACTPEPKAPKLSAGGRLVHVTKAAPPEGAREIGPIVAVDGTYCYGDDGTYVHALTILRNRAAARGGNFVELMTITSPHPDTRFCDDNRFIIRGMLYELPGTAADDTAVAEPDPSSCDPPCSPGFKCDEGACEPVCNPECAAGQVCRPDRTCGPGQGTGQ